MKTRRDKEFLSQLTYEWLTKANWNKFTALFGERGACGQCWCMSYRLSKTDFEEGKHDSINKDRMKKLVWQSKPAGILAMYEGEAIGWCALAPREDFVKLARSRVHKPIDQLPVWSIPCFFVDKAFRRQGVSVELLKAAVRLAAEEEIEVLEAYPTIPTQEPLPDAFAWIGLYRAFEQAGFRVVDRTSEHRPMMRYYIKRAKRLLH
jgi:GNAT superfamily N-acetyltransferase